MNVKKKINCFPNQCHYISMAIFNKRFMLTTVDSQLEEYILWLTLARMMGCE